MLTYAPPSQPTGRLCFLHYLQVRRRRWVCSSRMYSKSASAAPLIPRSLSVAFPDSYFFLSQPLSVQIISASVPIALIIIEEQYFCQRQFSLLTLKSFRPAGSWIPLLLNGHYAPDSDFPAPVSLLCCWIFPLIFSVRVSPALPCPICHHLRNNIGRNRTFYSYFYPLHILE